MSTALWAIGSAVAVSLIALIAAIPLLTIKKVPRTALVVLLSISVGTLLGLVFFELVPEIYSAPDEVHEAEHLHEELLLDEHHNESHKEEHNESLVVGMPAEEHAHEEEEVHSNTSIFSSILILLGFLSFFVLEKLVHHHHSHKHNHDEVGHSHGYELAAVNIVGDSVHNFVDGLVIAATYMVNIPLGIATTVSVLLHELPQEIADMGVLLYSGMSKLKAILYNVFAAAMAILGTIVGLLLSNTDGFIDIVLPFAAGMFIYIAASNLVPELHRNCGWKDTIIHVVSIIVGIAIIAAVILLVPHTH
jgi:zinc and cadmium transporter